MSYDQIQTVRLGFPPTVFQEKNMIETNSIFDSKKCDAILKKMLGPRKS
jgi:hypothetical protein